MPARADVNTESPPSGQLVNAGGRFLRPMATLHDYLARGIDQAMIDDAAGIVRAEVSRRYPMARLFMARYERDVREIIALVLAKWKERTR